MPALPICCVRDRPGDPGPAVPRNLPCRTSVVLPFPSVQNALTSAAAVIPRLMTAFCLNVCVRVTINAGETRLLAEPLS